MKHSAHQNPSRPPSRPNRDPKLDRNLDQSPPPTRPGRGGYRKGSGRPIGSIVYKARDFICKAAGFRVVKDAAPEVVELADFALQVITDIAAGRVRSQIAGVQLRAAVRLRDETCDPIPTASNIALNGGLSLVNILTGLRTQIEAQDPDAFEPKALPSVSSEELEKLAETIGYPGSADLVAAVLAKDTAEGVETEEIEDGEVEVAPGEAEPGDPPTPAEPVRPRADPPLPARG